MAEFDMKNDEWSAMRALTAALGLVAGILIALLILFRAGICTRKPTGRPSELIFTNTHATLFVRNTNSPGPTNGQVVNVGISNAGPPILATNPWGNPTSPLEERIKALCDDYWDTGAEFGFLCAKRGGTTNDLQMIKTAMRAHNRAPVEKWFEEHP